LNDSSPVALRGPSRRKNLELPCGFPLGRNLLPKLTAGLGFLIQSLCHRRRTSNLTQSQNLNLEISAIVADVEHVPGVEFTRRLYGLSVALDSSQGAGSRGERSSFEESSCPQPFIHAHACHGPVSW